MPRSASLFAVSASWYNTAIICGAPFMVRQESTLVWFGKKDRPGGVPPHLRGGDQPAGPKPSFYRIEFDMLKKGAVFQRRGKPIRQFAVTVNMSTRVVTSGEVVDRETYEALVAAGAVDLPAETTFNADRGVAMHAPAPPPGPPGSIEE